MARKRSGGGGTGGGGRRPRRGRPAQPPEGMPPVPDRRQIEGMMRAFLGQAGGEGGTPAQQAQDLIYEAAQTGDPRRRAEMARRALELWSDCADAYVMLAEAAPDHREALRLYEQGVAAGERALGPRAFQEDVGHFWGILETRPYMRARVGLAQHLWMQGRREEAVGHLQDMLRLNPNDNQGLRYVLAGWLGNLRRDEELAALLDRYHEATAMWSWNKALLAFRREGDTPAARKLLKAALKANKHVVPYITGESLPPLELPGAYSPGDESEAIIYVHESLPGWKETPGAVDWVRAHAAAPASGRRRRVPERAEMSAEEAVNELLALPREEDVWQADCRQLPVWVNDNGRRTRPQMVAVLSCSTQQALSQEVIAGQPAVGTILQALVTAARSEAAQTPHRPRELQVPVGGVWQELRPHLERAEIALVESEHLEEADSLFRWLGERIGEEGQPALVEAEGITPELLADFYEAAATFFERAPWHGVAYESAIRIESPLAPGGVCYGVLMGQSGMTYGLALYEDVELLRRMWRGNLSDAQNARLTVATVVTYGEDFTVAFPDLDDIHASANAGGAGAADGRPADRPRLRGPAAAGRLDAGERRGPGGRPRGAAEAVVDLGVTAPCGPLPLHRPVPIVPGKRWAGERSTRWQAWTRRTSWPRGWRWCCSWSRGRCGGCSRSTGAGPGRCWPRGPGPRSCCWCSPSPWSGPPWRRRPAPASPACASRTSGGSCSRPAA
jgi:tetratricopeptide (TPR) repeat protein